MPPTPPQPAKHWSTETHSVRERFSLGVMLLAIVYASVLFTAFGVYEAPWQFPVFFATLFIAVAIAQLALRRQGKPRTVSCLVGMFLFGGWVSYLFVNEGIYLLGIIVLSPVVFGFGALFGYIAGALDSSLFLIHDAMRDSMRAKRIEREALMAANDQKPQESPFDN